MSEHPPLKPLHRAETLIQSKLVLFDKRSSEDLKESLVPGQEHCLKARPDGTMLDGHHRIFILERRGVDVNALPRETLEPSRDA